MNCQQPQLGCVPSSLYFTTQTNENINRDMAYSHSSLACGLSFIQFFKASHLLGVISTASSSFAESPYPKADDTLPKAADRVRPTTS